MNLREFVKTNDPNIELGGYSDIVREERYFCAVLFHYMLQNHEGAKSLVNKITQGNGQIKGIFIEYAMARDLWKCIGDKNEAKRIYISQALSLDLPQKSIEEFNRLFVARKPSVTDIQSPARWGITTIFTNPLDTETKVKACKLKWAFNVKPDIVIELDNNGVICIEAKVESDEGCYAGTSEEKKTMIKCLGEDGAAKFKDCSRQCAVQEFLMKDVLGYEPVYNVFLSLGEKDKQGAVNLSWKEAFDYFSKDRLSAVIQRLEKIRK